MSESSMSEYAGRAARAERPAHSSRGKRARLDLRVGWRTPDRCDLPSPYSPRLRSKVLRASETGQYRERVDLVSDYRAAFGDEPGVLIGLAVSADSDDTSGKIVASIADLQLD